MISLLLLGALHAVPPGAPQGGGTVTIDFSLDAGQQGPITKETTLARGWHKVRIDVDPAGEDNVNVALGSTGPGATAGGFSIGATPGGSMERWMRVPALVREDYVTPDAPVTLTMRCCQFTATADLRARVTITSHALDPASAAPVGRSVTLEAAGWPANGQAHGPYHFEQGVYRIVANGDRVGVVDPAGAGVARFEDAASGLDSFEIGREGAYFLSTGDTAVVGEPFTATIVKDFADPWPEPVSMPEGATRQTIRGMAYHEPVPVPQRFRDGLVILEAANTGGARAAGPWLATSATPSSSADAAIDLAAVVHGGRTSSYFVTTAGAVSSGTDYFVVFPQAPSVTPGYWEITLRQPAADRLAPPPPADGIKGNGTQASDMFCLPAAAYEARVSFDAGTPTGRLQVWNQRGDVLASWTGAQGVGEPVELRVTEAGNHVITGNARGGWTVTLTHPDEADRGLPGLDPYVDCAQSAKTLTGRATTAAGGLQLPLAHARVRLTFEGSDSELVTNANATGHFSFDHDFVAGDRVQVHVDLTDEGSRGDEAPRIRVMSATRELVTWDDATATLGGEGTTFYANVLVHPASPSDAAINVTRRDELRDAAVIYAHLMEAVAYAEDTLGVVQDHALPVEVLLHAEGHVAAYYGSDSRIIVPTVDLPWTVPDRPANREYHEFGHHVHTDTVFGGENTLPPLGTTDRNHGNMINTGSNDSIIEGFAEWFGARVAGSPHYIGFDLEDPGEPRLMVRVGSAYIPVKGEEIHFAALLWDLADATNEPSDTFAMTDREVVEHLAIDNPGTIRDFFEYLNRTFDGRRSHGAAAPLASLNDVEALFVANGFYADANDNGRYDAGEQPGYADNFTASDLPLYLGSRPRHALDPLPQEHALLSCEDAAGVDASCAIEVRVGNAARIVPPGRDGNVRVYVPMTGREVTFTPIMPGARGEPVTLSGAQWEQRVLDAIDAGADHALMHSFALEKNGVAQPTGFVATPAAEGVQLSWKPGIDGGRVIVVRAAGDSPATPEHGERIYDGTATSVTDTGAETRTSWTYAVFSVEEDALSTPALATLVRDEPTFLSAGDPAARNPDAGAAGGDAPPNDGATSSGGVGWLAVAAVLVLGGAGAWVWTRRRR